MRDSLPGGYPPGVTARDIDGRAARNLRNAERWPFGRVRKNYDAGRDYRPAQIVDSTILAPTGEVLERRLAEQQGETADGRGTE